MQKNVPHEGIRLPKQETFPKGFAAQAAGSYTAELEARDSNSHPCSCPPRSRLKPKPMREQRKLVVFLGERKQGQVTPIVELYAQLCPLLKDARCAQ